MKKITFFAALAFSCVGLDAVYSQVRIIPAGQPSFPSDQSDNAAEVDNSAIPNPFDYFSQESESSLSPESLGPDPFAASPSTSSPRFEAMEARPTTIDPSSLSSERHTRSVVDTIVDHAAVAGVQDASAAPVLWSVSPPAPNHVGLWLTRQQCVDGLWDNYPAQRAQECVKMWEHLNGYSHAACGCSGPCAVCSGSPTHLRNRYREQSDCGCAQASCDHLQDGTNCAQTSPGLPTPPELPTTAVSNSTQEVTNNGTSHDNVAAAARPLVR